MDIFIEDVRGGYLNVNVPVGFRVDGVEVAEDGGTYEVMIRLFDVDGVEGDGEEDEEPYTSTCEQCGDDHTWQRGITEDYLAGFNDGYEAGQEDAGTGRPNGQDEQASVAGSARLYVHEFRVPGAEGEGKSDRPVEFFNRR
jgi:hypothetical protein